jgi:hypothetical protein
MAGTVATSIIGYVRRHHLGLLALFIALGGTAYAAGHQTAPKNSVIAKSIHKGAVTRSKLAKNSVDGSKVKNHSLTGADLAPGSIGTVPNASSLGGTAAGGYVKGASQIPAGGDLAGTYDKPLVQVGKVSTIPAPFNVGFSTNPAPAVTVDVPASGLVEALAWATLSAGASSTTYVNLEIDGTYVEQVLAVNASTKTMYTRQETSFIGTEKPQAAQWIPIFTTPGKHTISLSFHAGGPNAHSAEKVHLLARAFS